MTVEEGFSRNLKIIISELSGYRLTPGKWLLGRESMGPVSKKGRQRSQCSDVLFRYPHNVILVHSVNEKSVS